MTKLAQPSEVIVVPLETRSPVLKSAAIALKVIDGLHRIPRRPPCFVNVRRHRGAQGYYESHPPHIDLDPAADHPALTLAHEIGHFLDNQCLHAIYRAWASEIDPDFDELTKVWIASRLVKELARLQKTFLPRLTGVDRSYVQSLTASRELWACTYAQWVATKSNHPAIVEELSRHIQPTGRILGTPYTTQWEPNDFKGIMQAVDNLFSKRGWL